MAAEHRLEAGAYAKLDADTAAGVRTKRRVVRLEPEYDAYGQTDTGMARRFVERFGAEFRYCEDLGGWLHYDGTRFERKATAAAYQRIDETAADIWLEVAGAPSTHRKELVRFATRADSAQGKAAALALARYMPPVPAKVEEFDADPWALNTPSGTIDLRTGSLRAHEAADLLTKSTTTPFDPAADCPRWLDFLRLVFEDNAELIAYVQRALGYSISGRVSDHVLFFAYGTGRNGKSTLLGVVQSLLGDYARTADPELLIQRRGEVHPTNVASLHGARFVPSVETEDGRRFAEVLVKWLTGGDRLTARHMRQDFFEFAPTHHIFLAANHKPAVRGTDAGIWSRIHLIPFAVHLPSVLGTGLDAHFWPTLYMLGSECQRRGEGGDATAKTLHKRVSEALADKDPPAFRDAQSLVRELRAQELRAEIVLKRATGSDAVPLLYQLGHVLGPHGALALIEAEPVTIPKPPPLVPELNTESVQQSE